MNEKSQTLNEDRIIKNSNKVCQNPGLGSRPEEHLKTWTVGSEDH